MRGFVHRPEVPLRLHRSDPGEEAPARRRAHRVVLLAQVLILAALAVWSWHRTAAAEADDPPGRVARLSHLQGPVSFRPAGESEWVEAARNRPLTSGDRLWADPGARAELSTGSTTARLESSTDLGLTTLDDDLLQLQLTHGEVTLRVRWLRPGERVEVDTPHLALSIGEPGSYRVEASEDGSFTLVTVRAGGGEASSGGELHAVRAGQTVRFGGAGRLGATGLPLRALDDLEAWGGRRDRRSADSPSARHVSRDVVGYEELDEGGTWGSDASNGDVWFPRAVPSGWAPYRDGRWAWIAPWGYTWVDEAAWGFAPFHYGRWVSLDGRWGWVPGPVVAEAVYAPALVAFIRGPGLGLSPSVGAGGTEVDVGWFPLGPHEVYVPGFRASPGYVSRVNLSNTTVSSTTIAAVYDTQTNYPSRATTVRYVNRTALGAVTFVPRTAFAGGQQVAPVAVRVDVWRFSVARVAGSAGVAPSLRAVLGPSSAGPARRPPAAVLLRAVVTRASPPAPPVSFARQQGALEARPGLPLPRAELDGLRPPLEAGLVPVSSAEPLAPGKAVPARGVRAPARERRLNPPRLRAPGVASSAVR